MSKRKYGWRDGSRVVGVKAAIAGATLEALRKEEGTVRAARVVEIAEPEDHPLHPAFTWDDAEAGAKLRLIEARQLIRAVVIVEAQGKSRSAYEHVPSAKGEGTYEPGEVLVRRPDMFTLALEEALRALTSAQDRVAGLRRYAEDDQDRMAVVMLAAQALQSAEAAIRKLH